MSKSLALQTNTGSFNWVIGALVIGLIIWFITKNKLAYNEESVTIQRDERGRIAGMTVHRSAK